MTAAADISLQIGGTPQRNGTPSGGPRSESIRPRLALLLRTFFRIAITNSRMKRFLRDFLIPYPKELAARIADLTVQLCLTPPNSRLLQTGGIASLGEPCEDSLSTHLRDCGLRLKIDVSCRNSKSGIGLRDETKCNVTGKVPAV